MADDLTIEQARQLVREQEEIIKLHTIWILLGAPPIGEKGNHVNQINK